MAQITLIGYGNQGQAWAKNLKDSGWDVTVSGRNALNKGTSIERAQKDGFATCSLEEALENRALHPIAILIPDEKIPLFFQTHCKDGSPRTFVFAHGFAVTYGKLPLSPQDNSILVAPKGIGKKLRENYVAGSGVMGVLAVSQDASGNSWELARAIATGLGCHRVGLLESTFSEETNADLFSEQILLCGGIPHLLDASIRHLVKKGINPTLATYECLHETKLIVDMMVEWGVAGMLEKVSSTARFGGIRASEYLLPQKELQPRMEKLWEDIESGVFAQEFSKEIESGSPISKKGTERYRNPTTNGTKYE